MEALKAETARNKAAEEAKVCSKSTMRSPLMRYTISNIFHFKVALEIERAVNPKGTAFRISNCSGSNSDDYHGPYAKAEHDHSKVHSADNIWREEYVKVNADGSVFTISGSPITICSEHRGKQQTGATYGWAEKDPSAYFWVVGAKYEVMSNSAIPPEGIYTSTDSNALTLTYVGADFLRVKAKKLAAEKAAQADFDLAQAAAAAKLLKEQKLEQLKTEAAVIAAAQAIKFANIKLEQEKIQKLIQKNGVSKDYS